MQRSQEVNLHPGERGPAPAAVLDTLALGERQMTLANLLPDPLAGHAKAISGREHTLPAHDILAGIITRSTGNQRIPTPDWLDPKRLVERAIEIDSEEPGSPLTEGQWDYGLDMLA